MILERGVIRTLDGALPTASALAIAGDRIAGGVGTHEDALPSPDRVDLGGRCVVPGLSDAHVHFPTWALAQREVRLEGVASVEEAVARVRDGLGSVREGGWLRARGWRDAGWAEPPEPRGSGRGCRRRARRASGPRLALALAELRGARAGERRSRGRGRRGRTRRRGRADRNPPRGGVLELPRPAPGDDGRGVPRGDARGPAGGRGARASRPSTTRTAGSVRCGSGRRSQPRAHCRSASGSRFRPTTSTSSQS